MQRGTRLGQRVEFGREELENYFGHVTLARDALTPDTKQRLAKESARACVFVTEKGPLPADIATSPDVVPPVLKNPFERAWLHRFSSSVSVVHWSSGRTMPGIGPM